MRPTISVLLPVFNCENTVRATLESIKWVDEILVVDSFSTDHSLEICRDYGARIVQHEYENSAKQKNWAIPQCSSDWVLQIDSDEVVEPALADEIVRVLEQPLDGIGGFDIPFKPYILGGWLEGAGYYPDYHLRLFRKSTGRFQDKQVHARVTVTGRVVKLQNPILHYDAVTVSKWLNNLDRYARYESEQFLKRSKGSLLIRMSLYPWGAFLNRYLRLGGVKHGFRGFFVSVYASIYVFFKYAKVVETSRRKDTSLRPDECAPGPDREPGSAEKRVSLTVILPVHGRVEHLGEALESVRWADEILLVDSSGDDRVDEICVQRGARLVRAADTESFDLASLVRSSSHEWILHINADEVLENGARDEIEGAVQSAPESVYGFAFPRKNHILGQWVRHGGYYPDAQLRLFRKQSSGLDGDTARPSAPFVRPMSLLASHLDHDRRARISDWVRELDRDTTSDAEEKIRDGLGFSWGKCVLGPIGEFLYRYVWKLGFADGFAGYFVSVHAAIRVFLTWAKLWEKDLTLDRKSAARNT